MGEMETNGEESEIDTEKREEDDWDECGLRVQWRVREDDGRGVVDGERWTEVALQSLEREKMTSCFRKENSSGMFVILK
jgi:hypothetical protein